MSRLRNEVGYYMRTIASLYGSAGRHGRTIPQDKMETMISEAIVGIREVIAEEVLNGD